MSSKIFKIKKDKKIREYYKRKEFKLLLYKYTAFSCNNINYKRYYVFKFIKKFHLNSSKSRVVNRCLFTGRSGWILSRYKVSRIKFKELCDYGKLHGVRRASY